jgi:hypothetical protein
MDRVSYGIPAYGMQSPNWWAPFVAQAAGLFRYDIELVRVHVAMGMMTDLSRNTIVDQFLKSDVEWLRWLDADNVDKAGSLRRLLDCRKTLVTGLYTKRDESLEPHAYFRTEDSYERIADYTPGEIIPIEAAGMGGCLVHRSVFEDILKNYRVFNMLGGGVFTIHKDDIHGDVFDESVDELDGKLVDGVLHLRARQTKIKRPFPFFILADGRTEDYGFFEMAARSGHKLWLDSGVEISHLGEKSYSPAQAREKEIRELQKIFYEALPLT